MAEPYIAQIIPFAGNFAIRGWAFCHGQLLSISQNTALFSLIGTIYGGDGRTTMGLPDMRGRVPIQAGNGPGLSDYRLGEKGGTEQVTLNVTEIPQHNHAPVLHAQRSPADSALGAAGNMFAGGAQVYATLASGNEVGMNGAAVTSQNVGGGLPHYNIQPFLCINFEIALVGIFPSRN